MITITKKLRFFRGGPESPAEQERFRPRSRKTLNRPYQFKPKVQEIVPTWPETSLDPLVSVFKPFSRVTPAEVLGEVAAEVKSEITHINRPRLARPVFISVLLLATVFIRQIFFTASSSREFVSPVPAPVRVQNVIPVPEQTPVSSPTIPAGTELQPGGPYTGTGGYEPPPAGVTNLAKP